MTSAIMNCFSAVTALIAFCVIYVFTLAKPLPYFLLSANYRNHTPKDREIKKYRFPEGRGVVCSPDEKYVKYFKKYVIFSYKKQKYIKCKLSEDVVSIRYDVLVYDGKNDLIKTLELAQNLTIKGETDAIRLPDDAACVSVILKAVNETEIFSSTKRISFTKICIFTAITVMLTVACGLLTRTAVLNIATLLNLQWQIELWINLITSIMVGALISLWFLSTTKNNSQVKNND